MEDAIIERLGNLIKALDCNKSSFANKIDMPQASIATLFMRGKTISSQLLARISRVFPQVNIEWLITGNGSMLKSEQPASIDPTLIAELKEEINDLKSENNQLKGENKILRELAGLAERKESKSKSA